jgi:glycosyltransferase involved in cell wall biosynthesis
MTPKAGLLAMMAAMMARVPVRLHTFTGLVFPYVNGWKRWLYRMSDRVTAACATHLIPEGEGVKADLIRFGVTGKPLEVLGYGNVRGIDLRHYDRTPEVMAGAGSLRERFGIGPDTLTFVFVGRFDVDKGLRELLWAFTHLRDSFGNVHLLLAGGTEEGTPALSPELMDTMEACTSIHMSDGWVSDVRPWLAAADVLVHPSYREGFPNVVIEAGAMGLPSVVTDINGSREIISEGVNGLIVPPGSAISLYSAMKRFAEKPALSSELAANARRIVAERYEQGYVRACLRAYYQSIMK